MLLKCFVAVLPGLEKHFFVLNVTFTASEKTMSEVYGVLNSALNEIRKITQRASPDRLYQVNVQLFPWL